jgi:hypothetical protein
MDELVEKMARAMLNWVEPKGFRPWGIERNIELARAALAAIEEAGFVVVSKTHLAAIGINFQTITIKEMADQSTASRSKT